MLRQVWAIIHVDRLIKFSAAAAVVSAALLFSSCGKATDIEAGDIYVFGSFEQDADKENGPEELEWIVMDINEDSMLLLSRYVLVPMRYNEDYVDVTWETSSLRAWLNDEFMNMVFSEEEKERILLTVNENPGNPIYDTVGGNTTEDKVFIFSSDEANAYLYTDEQKFVNGSAEPTEYAREMGTVLSQKEGYEGRVTWWLRTPGVFQYSAAFVDSDGYVYPNGAVVNNDTYSGVRPAVCIKR